MTTPLFNPVDTPLHKGVNLIEASAGTGKTYAIAMLALRFVVEQDIPIEQLLAVTFTKAATEELKDRIRLRLADARRALNGPLEHRDPAVSRWLQGLTLEPTLIKRRIELALLNIDQAGLFTIHGFCQRVLKEHALESGQMFDAELTSELAAIRQDLADDFWRRHVYLRSPWEAGLLTAQYRTPGELLASVDRVAPRIDMFPEAGDLDAHLAFLKQLAETAADAIDAAALQIANRFAEQTFKAAYAGAFTGLCQELKVWLQGASHQLPSREALALLTRNGLMAGLNGNKFKTTQSMSGERRRTDYLTGLGIDTAPFDALELALNRLTLNLRLNLLAALRSELDARLQQLNVLSFDDLITRLSDALRGEHGGQLIAELRQRFQAALIDEFQDTDITQWHIFSTLFAADSQYLYLIGDPKQAIYKFRGADIYAYLDAQQHAQHRFTLGHNWRSHPGLVHAVNAVFQKEHPFLLAEIAFEDVAPARTEADGALYVAGRPVAPLMFWQLGHSDGKNGYWTSGKAALEIESAVVGEIIALLNNDFTLHPKGCKVQANDIAILVRTNTQAREYQAALRAAGVPSVLNSTESVFATQEALDLFKLLQAIAHPGDHARLREALTLDWFGLDGQAFRRLINDESAIDARTTRFIDYHRLWQQKGLLVMMQHVLVQENIGAALARTAAPERALTNLRHLFELIQLASSEEHLGINKTLDWLAAAISTAHSGNGAEDRQLRLESDDDAVHIVTMHRSKGLEYGIVFCPCLWQRSDQLQNEKYLIQCHEEGRMIADLGSEAFETRRAQALNEELAEHLRILYVAVTRAKYRCYVAWADQRSEKNPNASALAWLLDLSDLDFAGQQAKLAAFKETAPDLFDFAELAVPVTLERVNPKSMPSAHLRARPRTRSLYTAWQMSSYTALSALGLADAPELPKDKADEHPGRNNETASSLPGGAPTGNVVHALLENVPFAALAEGKDISEERDKACRRFGVSLERPELLDDLLKTVVATPLSQEDTDFCLKNLDRGRCLKEMPFYLSMPDLNTERLNRTLQDSPAFHPLAAKQMSGFLTGFIDLVCEYRGRFYVMDYKTNHLPDYSHPAMLDAMREHNYGLQYWLYTLVLHRYLEQRLPDYRFERDFGGVRYLFVRGMQPDQPMRGVYQDRPDPQKIAALAELFEG